MKRGENTMYATLPKKEKKLTERQIRLIERARKLSGAGKVKNPSNAVETINELRGKTFNDYN